MSSSKKIFLALIIILAFVFCSRYFMRSSKSAVIQDSQEFHIEFKDVNISYKYFGFDLRGCDKTSVLIVTLSRPNASQLRMGIRNSWKKDIPNTFTHKFFIGLSPNKTLQQINENEARKFGDIVFTNIIDTYLNLTHKISSVFQWQHHFCSKVDFFLRTNDDSVLDVSRFQYWLNLKFNMFKRSYSDSLIFANLLQKSPIRRNPAVKRYVPYESYGNENSPPYESASCYLTTPHSIKIILEEAKHRKFIAVGDALFNEIIAEKVFVKRINASRHFGCQNPLATSSWDHECDDNGVPFLFSTANEKRKLEDAPYEYEKALRKLKELKCPAEK